MAAFAAFALVSTREGETRAARISWGLAVGGSLPLLLAANFSHPVPILVLAALGVVVILGLGVWFAPLGRVTTLGGRPQRRFDERDIMFARNRLVPGSPEYQAYYREHPEYQAGDDRTRALPGILSPQSEMAEPVFFAAAKASFSFNSCLDLDFDGPTAKEKVELTPRQWHERMRDLALYYGATSCGVCALRPYHIYTHVGRGAGGWGEPIKLDSKWAIAFTVEMDHDIMACTPQAPVIMESARQYVEAAKIALHLAAVIRSCGFAARAHIDGNYQVIAPLVARDAGLGEIGRMGLLMTPHLGPRVRIGVVTTDLPLEPDEPGDDLSVIDFCSICKKCADNCPVAAVPSGDRQPIDDGLRWAIDSETCHRYWAVIGTDCGRCMSVCPYSHPDNPAHNLVRWAIRNSAGARRVGLWMDDLFYGRKPGIKPDAFPRAKKEPVRT